VISFIGTSALATAASMGLFVLLDPRAQAFWGARFTDLANAIRSLVGLR
jgi:hypothetical protein